MNDNVAGLIQVGVVFAALALCWRPLGDYMAWVFTSERDLRVERVIYRMIGVDPKADQRWKVYAGSVLAVSVVGFVLLFALQKLQSLLPLSLGLPAVPTPIAVNTAVSFVTNTNWQSYSGESTMGHLVQMAGLAVQNFVSGAVGIAVAVALIRAFTRTNTDRLGNFWADLTRGLVRILLPIAFVSAIVLVGFGAIQNLSAGFDVTTLTGGTQHVPGGPVASQEVIKLLGTNGGGFFNANSAHPFENPSAFSNMLEIFLILLIPVSLTRTFGTMVGDRRQGVALLGTMVTLFVIIATSVTLLELHRWSYSVAGTALEGKEMRLGVIPSTIFAAATTGTSTGAVNSFHSSFDPIGGGLLILNMGLGEVAPGGVGTGVYGLLVMAIVAVFIAGLMVGRTPEYLGKKLRAREMKLVSLTILTMPLLVLFGTGLAMALPGPRESILNAGPHGLSEVLYAFTSASNNNGSAFAGLNANTNFYNYALAICMWLGRFVPIVLTLALAGSLARQTTTPRSAGTLPTHGPLFVTMLCGVVVIVAGLTFFPALALGPLAEGL
ncbi:potassium-transporting ATPase subunit KdpA [Nocardioides sp.]|uniref:potassium-transporting ATPase subunit KdpA n=1 Tax=Nocardioides sp. TaxID=35761 RepID=UPI002611662E|nr:potassium-transporting ATPase subunit KdpA [Nocardioides sp.]